MSKLVEYAKSELETVFSRDNPDDCEYADMASSDVLELVRVFAKQGHTNNSAPMILALFDRLARWKPIRPLTGEESEWNEISTDGSCQNKRCSSVFKDKNGRAYDIDGKYFVEPDGSAYTSNESRVDITFPYQVPLERKRVYVDEDGNPRTPVESTEDYERIVRHVNTPSAPTLYICATALHDIATAFRRQVNKRESREAWLETLADLTFYLVSALQALNVETVYNATLLDLLNDSAKAALEHKRKQENANAKQRTDVGKP